MNPGKVERVVFSSPGPIQPALPARRHIQAPDSLHLRVPAFTNAQANSAIANMRSYAIRRCAVWFGRKLASDEEADEFQTCLNSGLGKSTVCDTAKALPAVGGGGYYAQLMTVLSFAKSKDPRQALKNTPLYRY